VKRLFNRRGAEDAEDAEKAEMSFDQLIVSEEWEETDLSLLETLDHVLNRGLVIAGEITISVADIDLIFVGLNVLVSSIETAHEVLRKRQTE
jgi:gas vesicle structural protein